MESEKLLSIVIPTRERAETLGFTLRTALAQTTNNYEVIVSDNFSQDNTKSVVAKAADHRVRYVNTERRMSMCDNWEIALDHSRGKYIIFIVDEDAIMPDALDWF